MPRPKELDPSVSVAAHFGAEVRHARVAAGLSQEALGGLVGYTGSYLGQIETAKRMPSKELADGIDRALNTGGSLARLWPLVSRAAYPVWFRDFVELESRATQIHKFSTGVPGLLQTEDYARAVLRAGLPRDTPEVTDEKVAARMARQRIMAGPTPPLLWIVLDEAALRRAVGGPAVIAAQLNRIVEASTSPYVTVQVLPFSSGAHASTESGLTLLSFEDSHDIAYVEVPHGGRLLSAKAQVADMRLAYDHVRADALSPEASVHLINSAATEAMHP